MCILRGVRFLLANQTQLSTTSETFSYVGIELLWQLKNNDRIQLSTTQLSADHSLVLYLLCGLTSLLSAVDRCFLGDLSSLFWSQRAGCTAIENTVMSLDTMALSMSWGIFSWGRPTCAINKNCTAACDTRALLGENTNCPLYIRDRR